MGALCWKPTSSLELNLELLEGNFELLELYFELLAVDFDSLEFDLELLEIPPRGFLQLDFGDDIQKTGAQKQNPEELGARPEENLP